MSSLTQFAGGGVKSVQSGVFGAAGSASITSVNTTKAIIHCVSKGSAGTVAASGTVASHALLGYLDTTYSGGHGIRVNGASGPPAVWDVQVIQSGGTNSASASGLTAAAASISGGTTNLTVKQYSAVITNATTVTADGPCEWQVVEYY